MLQSPDLACLQFQKYKLDAAGKPLFAKAKDGKVVAHARTQAVRADRLHRGRKSSSILWDDLEKSSSSRSTSNRGRKPSSKGRSPFLFNMRPAEPKMRYAMTLSQSEREYDYLIGIVPREQIEQAELHCQASSSGLSKDDLPAHTSSISYPPGEQGEPPGASGLWATRT